VLSLTLVGRGAGWYWLQEPLRFPRDDKKMATVWPAYNLPTTRQGIDKIVVQ